MRDPSRVKANDAVDLNGISPRTLRCISTRGNVHIVRMTF